ncbi:MAG: ComF family protein [Clostridiales bacterium]|nr:ComF family protein [Clostridiales bacterium]
MRIQALAKAAMDLVFPQVRCLCCDEPREINKDQPLCEACMASLEGLRIKDTSCPNCLSPKTSGQSCAYCADGGMAGLERAYAPYAYKDEARKLIMALKFGPVLLAAKPLAMEMALCISGVRFDALVPVPLHKDRQRERGMNQSEELCKLIEEYTGLPVLLALSKKRKTKRQSDLPKHLRHDNVKDAFEATMDVLGLDIVLVDDVRTTGSTARECAKALKEAGAASVSLLTAAVAGGGRHDELA